MKKLFISLMLTLTSGIAMASSGGHLMDFTPNLKDKAGLQSGAKTFVNYCFGCHSMQYMRYGRLATDLGIPDALVEEHFIFNGSKISALMKGPVAPKQAKKWFGAAPPDLTLVARVRGDKWLYTYLKSFYLDPSRPYGYNNLLFKDVGMPNVLQGLQGDQTCAPAYVAGTHGRTKRDPITHEFIESDSTECGRAAHVSGTGELSPEEFDKMVSDLVSFLVYAGEPVKIYDRTFLGMDLSQREVYGVYSLLFLMVLGVFVVLLNREYWKDIH
ncbi:MAG: cytochrome c1 [Pseudomonadales bacterium]|nr:cytochrome c1 [Pseudomonadales bacterium]